MQRLEHPSPLVGPPSWSSHCSEAVIMPSPQTSMQMSGVKGVPPEHWYPGREPEQSALHPTPFWDPSSQSSAALRYPSPQIPTQVVRSKGDEGYSSWVVQVIAGLFSS